MGEKIKFSHDINSEYVDMFEEICDKLGPPKYRVLEAAIQVFASLPISIQYILRGYDDDERKICFDLIGKLQQRARQTGRQKTNSPKSG